MAVSQDDMKEQLINSKESKLKENNKPSAFDTFLSYAIPATGTLKGGFFTSVLGIVSGMRALFSLSKLHYFLLPLAPILELLELVWDAFELKKAPKKTPEKIVSVIFNVVKFFAVTSAVVLLLVFAVKLGALAGLTGGIIFTAVTGAVAVFNTIFAVTKSIRAYVRNRRAKDLEKFANLTPDVAAKAAYTSKAQKLRQQAEILKIEVKYHVFGAVLSSIMTPLIALVFIKGIFGVAIAGSAVAGAGALVGFGMFIYDKFIKKPTPVSTKSSTLNMDKVESDSDSDLDQDREQKLNVAPKATPAAPDVSAPSAASSATTSLAPPAPAGQAPQQAIDSLPQQAKTTVAIDARDQSPIAATVVQPAKVIVLNEAPAKQYITPAFLSQVLKNIASKPVASDKVFQNARQERHALNHKEADQFIAATPTIKA